MNQEEQTDISFLTCVFFFHFSKPSKHFLILKFSPPPFTSQPFLYFGRFFSGTASLLSKCYG